MEHLVGGLAPGVLEPPMESSCKCFNILSGSMKLSCLHSQEENRGAGISKVSQIATMFQPHQDFEEKEECLGPSQVSVVRTESHVARFNTARALFEKMAEQKGGGDKRSIKETGNKRIVGGSGGVGGVGRGTPSPSSSGGKSLSRSPSPCSPRSLIHSNGFSSYPTKPVSISGSPIPTISSLSSTSPPTPSTFHTTISNTSITSVLPHHPGANILSPRTFSETTDPSRGRWAPVIKSELSKAEMLNDKNRDRHSPDKFSGCKIPPTQYKSSVSYSNKDFNRQKYEEERHNLDNSRDASHEQPSKPEPNTYFRTPNNKFNNTDSTDSCKISRDHYNNRNDSSMTRNSSAKSDMDCKPAKPTKPEMLSDKHLISSHLQNQKIIQRHKNWFHTFSKSKSPVSSPNKMESQLQDSSTSTFESRIQSTFGANTPKERLKGKSGNSFECEDGQYKNEINSSRKHVNEISFHKRKSLDDLDSISTEEIQSTHNDWRRERAAILAGRTNSRLTPGEEADKTPSLEEKVRNYDNVSTLPSSWCPPKQYNAAAKDSRSDSIPAGASASSQQDPAFRNSPASGGDNYSENESRYSESGSNTGSLRDGYVVRREVSEVHRSSFDAQKGHRDSASPSSDNSHKSRKSEKAKHESSVSSDVVNERLQRQSTEAEEVKLRKFKAVSNEDVRRSYEVKLEVKDGSLKRNSYEVDREKRLREWERKRVEKGQRLSDEIKVHNIRVSDISAFTKNQEKINNDEVIWVKRETNTGSLDSRRLREENKKREEDTLKEEKKLREEELERRRRDSVDKTRREEEIKRRKMEEYERHKREEIERKRIEEIENQRLEEEERRRKEELEKQRKEELELKRKRKLEEIEQKKLEEERERKQREKEERERLQREKEERERLQREKEERERLQREKEERERLHREKEESERLQREKEEREILQKEKEERERVQREKEEKAILQREKEEREILQREKEEREILQREKEEREILQREKEEREIRQAEERDRIKKEEERRMKQEADKRERRQKEKEEMAKESERKQIEEEESRRKEELKLQRKLIEEEELRKREDEERLLREKEIEEERVRQEDIRRNNEENVRRLKEEEERNRELNEKKNEQEVKRLSKLKLEDDERVMREKDRMEIEKTKRRIAELKKEREELQRQQLVRMQQILVDENENGKVIVEKEEVIRINLDEISNEERKNESIAALDALVHGHQRKPKTSLEFPVECGIEAKSACDTEEVLEGNASLEYLDENKSSNIEYTLVDASEITDDVEVTDISTTDVDVTEVDQSTSSNSSHITDKSVSEKPELTFLKSDKFRKESSLDDVLQTPVEEVYYDPTVTSAQYKIQFCSSPLGISPISRDDAKAAAPYRSQLIDTSTLSSEFEPLPPPIPPHNVNPATIMSDGYEVNSQNASQQDAQSSVPADDRLDQLADLMEYVDADDPEVMTPEEEKKLLSYKGDSSLLSDAQAKEVSKILSQTKDASDTSDGSCFSSQRIPEVSIGLPEDSEELSEVSNKLPEDSIEFPEENSRASPPVDYDEEPDSEISGVPIGLVTSEGFVVRAKEVLYEDGIHYFEDGNFWIEVPGLQENDEDDDDDEFPEHIPFHKHTKLKFSTAPIQLFSTFSVSDYDRKNEDVDPVAASAEYELEKRVEKMDVFPVQIEKGEGGLGLSIIGMGVGADAGVEKLGIFVKTISPGGATDKDGRIRVNDQIIEVDSQSLVGVTQMYAASVLKNTNGTVNFLIGREQDPENSEVAMLIRQSLMADLEREERRRALGGPNYDPNNGGVFESFSSPSGGDSPSEETSRNNISQYDEVGEVNPYGEEGCEEDYADSFGSCPNSPQPRMPSSPTVGAVKNTVENAASEMVMMSQHLMEVQHKSRLHEEEIIRLRLKINELEKELGDKVESSKSLEDMTTRFIDIEDKLQSRQAEIATYQDMLEQSQGQYIVLEKKYYKAKKIIKEYQSRERDFLHREEYHITQLEEKDALYNSLVKALKDRVIQLEGDLVKAQQQAGLPVVVPPDLNAQSSHFVNASRRSSSSNDNQMMFESKEPPRKPATLGTLDPDLSDTEGCDTQTSESSKASTVERKIPLKEELDVAVPPHELLDVSFSKAKGELATRGGLANRQLPSLKKTASSSSAGSFDRSLDDGVDDGFPESQQQLLFPSAESTSSAATVTASNISSSSYSRHEEVFQQSVNTSSHSFSSSTAQHQTSQTNSFPQHNGFGRPPPPYHPPQGHNPPSYASPPQSQFSHTQTQLSSYSNNQTESQHIQSVTHQSQPPPYQPPPSAPLSHRSLVTSEANTGRSEMPYRHPPPIARVQPVNRVEAPPDKPPTPTSPQYGPRTPQQQSLAHQLKTLLAEREATTELSTSTGNVPQSPIKKSASMLMEDVRQAVMQADLSIGKKPMISGPIHVSSTAQVVSTGQFVQHRGSPVRNSGGNSSSQQRVTHDFGSWSPKSGRSSQSIASSVVAPSNTSGIVLLSKRPIDSSLPPLNNENSNLTSADILNLPTGSQGSLVDEGSTSSFDSQPSPSHLQDKNRLPGYSRDAVSVLDWTKEQVGQWLVLQGMEIHVGKFISAGITGPRLVNIDTKDLKTIGLSTDEKNKIKRKVKELRQNLEKERKQIEKERKEREKLQKKAEKLAKEAEKRKK